jgi:hypothetical protein
MRVVLSNRDNFRPSARMVQALLDLKSVLITSLSVEGYLGANVNDAEADSLAKRRGLIFQDGQFYLVNDARSMKTRSHPDFVAVAESLGSDACFFGSSFDILEIDEGADALVGIETRQGLEHLVALEAESVAAVA